MEKSSFFNSVSGDRKYKAEDWASYFGSFIGNGVFPVPSTGLQVVAGSGMQVTVKAGKAWINGYFYNNTSDLSLTLATADGVLNRIDRIVVRWDLTNRVISVKAKSSSYSASPTAPAVERDADIYELAIADVYVGAGVTAIIQSSSASVGILQALSTTGAITYSAAIPIILGQNIGTCITAFLSSVGGSKNARRTAMVHFYFNLIGSILFLVGIYAIQYTVGF